MSLRSVIDGVESREKTLTVYDADETLVSALREYFASQQVVVDEGTAVGGPAGFATLSEGDRLLTAIDLDDLSTPLDGGRDLNPAFQTLLGHLDGTTFSSYDARQMVATSREIEDRAWRARAGQLHAGFQYFSALASQEAVYTRLAERDLDIHVYAAPDGAEVELPEGVTIHDESAAEITDSWFVVFDGGGTPSDKCALLAEERQPDAYYGFWTYDPTIVDDILAHLTEQYVTVA
jgi:DICT domain-containing protein